jgi:hypothetical protein
MLSYGSSVDKAAGVRTHMRLLRIFITTDHPDTTDFCVDIQNLHLNSSSFCDKV